MVNHEVVGPWGAGAAARRIEGHYLPGRLHRRGAADRESEGEEGGGVALGAPIFSLAGKMSAVRLECDEVESLIFAADEPHG